MTKWLTSALLSAMLWTGIFVFLRALELSLFSVPGLAVLLLLPVTLGALIAVVERLVFRREPRSGRILDLNAQPLREGSREESVDLEQMWRRRARMRFSSWKPGDDVTIH